MARRFLFCFVSPSEAYSVGNGSSKFWKPESTVFLPLGFYIPSPRYRLANISGILPFSFLIKRSLFQV